MGYRFSMVSCTWMPKSQDLPCWFCGKWDRLIRLTGPHWSSADAYDWKTWSNVFQDVRKMLRETGYERDLQFMLFADQGLIEVDHPDVTHVLVNASIIQEWSPDEWGKPRHIDEMSETGSIVVTRIHPEPPPGVIWG